MSSVWIRFLKATLAALVFASPAIALAEYPDRPIRIVVPYSPGGTTDLVARHVAKFLGEQFKQSVLVDNKPGANAIIGSQTVARSPADGYTLLFCSDTNLILNPLLYKNLPYKLADFTPVAGLVEVDQTVYVNSNSPIKTLAELVAHVKSKGQAINLGSAGLGGNSHLAGELFMQLTNTQMTDVVYKGGAPALAALIAGEVEIIFSTVGTGIGMVRAGRIRPLAVLAPVRSAVWPDVPTAEEAGLKGMDVSLRYGIVAPKGTPPTIIKSLNEAMNMAIADEKFKRSMLQDGMRANRPGSPDDYRVSIERDAAKYQKLIKDRNISIEQSAN